jgi:hypothetical protein
LIDFGGKAHCRRIDTMFPASEPAADTDLSAAPICQAYQKKTQPQSCRMGARAQAEVSDTTDQDIRDDEVENAPRYVDDRTVRIVQCETVSQAKGGTQAWRRSLKADCEGARNAGSANAPTATAITSGRRSGSQNTVEPQSGQK